MTTHLIDSPSEIFRRFAEAYATLDPLVPVSYDAKTAIPIIIDDICQGHETATFASGPNPFKKKLPPLEGTFCSKHFVGYLRTLRSMMKEQRTFYITPTRAAELLYNYDFMDERFTQPFMRLKQKQGCFYLVSTGEYERRYGAQLRLTLGLANDATDWTVTPNGWDDLPN
jgi:hypothetical protein